MRSKLLALHLIANVFQTHSYVFTIKSVALASSGEGVFFIDSVLEFLMMTLSRNVTSTVPAIFEVSMHIFGQILLSIRTYLKKEIAVFFTEIIIPILEAKKNISWYQRYGMIKSLTNILSCGGGNESGKLLVEIYVNYDCDVTGSAKENIWERLVNTLAKILSQHNESNSSSQLSPFPIPSFISVHQNEMPALTTTNLVAHSRDQCRDLISSGGDSLELKRVAMCALVECVLKPIVLWCDSKRDVTLLSVDSDDINESEKSTDSTEADLQAVGNLKMRKQAISEGVNRFNFKPKKVDGRVDVGDAVFIGDKMHN